MRIYTEYMANIIGAAFGFVSICTKDIFMEALSLVADPLPTRYGQNERSAQTNRRSSLNA